MENIRKIKAVEPKTEVGLFMRKPFTSDNNNQEDKNNNQGFQDMLDNSMKKLKIEEKSFKQTVQDVLDEDEEDKRLSTRELQLLELKRARSKFESSQRIKHDLEERAPRLR